MAASPGPWLRQRVYILMNAVDGGHQAPDDLVDEQDHYQIGSLKSVTAQVDGVLATLSEREAQAIQLRFGLDDGRSKTLKEAGLTIGVSGERVRQLEVAALTKLRVPARRTLLPSALR